MTSSGTHVRTDPSATDATAGLISYPGRLRAAAEARPGDPAIVFEPVGGPSRVVTWRQLDERSTQVARRFAELGVDTESTVVTGYRSCPEHAIAAAAGWKVGALVLPLKHSLPDRERDAILELAAPAVVAADWDLPDDTPVVTLAGLEHPGSVGRPAGCDLRILDEDGSELPPGEVGEVFTRPHAEGPTYRYIGSEPTKRTPDGFHSVGDLGWVDEEGYLFLADRRVDLIITGGSNVYPAEVEAVLTLHPGVGDVAVIGVPDDDLGKRVHAIVQPADPDDPVPADQLDAHVRSQLAAYKAPRTYEFVEDFPRDEAGKIRRPQLAAERAPA